MTEGFLFTNTITNRYFISVCYSGGVDSSYMLQNICYKKKAYLYLFIMYIFNDEDYNNYVQNILQISHCYNISFYIKFGDEDYNKCKHISQNSYRKIKSKFILSTLLDNNIHKTILCHNYNDNLETIIMKLNTNCSLKEISMPFVKNITYFGHDIKIIRPMLNIRRKDIEDKAVPVIIDKDNNNISYYRVSLRKFLMTDKKDIYSNIHRVLDYISNIYNYSAYKKLYLDFRKKTICFIRCNNISENLQLIKQANFLLVNDYSPKFRINKILYFLENNIYFCTNSCIVRFNNNLVEVTRNRFDKHLYFYKYTYAHIYTVLMYNFMRLEIISSVKLNIHLDNRLELYIEVDNFRIYISIKDFFFIDSVCIKNYYIIIILYISNHIKLKT